MQIKLKWAKEEFEVEIEAETTVEVFKTQVWTLTNVPVDRQKYIGFPGGMLKDTDDLPAKAAKLKAGAKITLVGTAEEKQMKAPVEQVVFEEDLTPEEKAKILKEKAFVVLPAGIKNLGNTCYMNSTLQSLFHVTELKDAVERYDPPAGGGSIDTILTTQYREVMKNLTNTTDAIVPLQFVVALRQKFPRFGEMQNGVPMQQDAEECMRGLLQVLSSTLASPGGNLVDDLCGFKIKSTLKCLECDEEPPSVTEESQRLLLCHLGTQTDPISHIGQGVALSLKEHIEKNSPVLGRNAQYEKSSAISTLPPYLILQFARFGYKAANEWAGTDASKVKQVRKIAFSNILDLFDCASDEVKNVLKAGRIKRKEQEDEKLEADRKAALAEATGASSSSAKAEEKADVEMKPADGDVEMKAADGIEEMDTGYYELISIVSHKGRTADGGHYVAWARSEKADGKQVKEDRWYLYDDETVSVWDWKDIVGLSTDLQGGKPDTQIAYINIYKKVTVTVDKGHVLGSKAEENAEKAPEASEKAAES